MVVYCCRNCGAFSSVKMGGCPVCDYSESEEYEVNAFDGGTVTKKRPWYKSHEVLLK